MTFRRGLRDGLPVSLGYLSVAFAYGVLARRQGMPAWMPIVVSLTNFTGTGQFVGTELLAGAASLLELATVMLVVNLRYALMSLSLSQRMIGVPVWKRLILAHGVTDENYAVAMRRTEPLHARYLAGLMLCSFVGWFGGTAAGALIGGVFPESLMSAFGIALYAMFVAIILPPARDSAAVLQTVVVSAALSALFCFTPYLNSIGSGYAMLIVAVGVAAFMAWMRPVKAEPREERE